MKWMPVTTIALLASLTVMSAPASHAADVKSHIIHKAQSSWDGTPYTHYPEGQPELTLVKIQIPARTKLKWHTHPIPNMAYVVSGELTVQKRDTGERIKLRAGDAVAELVDIRHRGVTGKHPVELLVFYAGSPNTPLSD